VIHCFATGRTCPPSLEGLMFRPIVDLFPSPPDWCPTVNSFYNWRTIKVNAINSTIQTIWRVLIQLCSKKILSFSQTSLASFQRARITHSSLSESPRTRNQVKLVGTLCRILWTLRLSWKGPGARTFHWIPTPQVPMAVS
jgi:hypothetical protein